MNLKESLSGGYAGLYGEVVETDVYEMRDVEDIVSINDPLFIHVKGHKRGFDFIPDVIFDLGANVGIFTRYCHDLFPDAKIIAVEPHPENFKYLPTDLAICINKGIGAGRLWRGTGAVNGSGESYVSNVTGFDEIMRSDSHIPVSIESITLKKLFDEFVLPGHKVIVKMDIEGGENALFEDEESVKCLLNADYVAMEIHNYALSGKDVPAVEKLTSSILERFEKTHDCKLNHIYFYARRNSDKA